MDTRSSCKAAAAAGAIASAVTAVVNVYGWCDIDWAYGPAKDRSNLTCLPSTFGLSVGRWVGRSAARLHLVLDRGRLSCLSRTHYFAAAHLSSAAINISCKHRIICTESRKRCS